MIKLSKLADYGIVMMTRIASHPAHLHSAAAIAVETQIPQPMASKILKTLAREGLLASSRGVKGGYSLAHPADAISVADIVTALDGPIALTACIVDAPGSCDIERLCPARANWQRINEAIKGALDGITLAEMVASIPPAFALPGDAHLEGRKGAL